MKRIFYSEWAYVGGILLLALGTALMEKADFGMGMVVAPAYLLHLKLSQSWPFFSFGMAEYVLQAALLLFTALLLRRARPSYLVSFLTALFYGSALDGCIWLMRAAPATLPARLGFYAAGVPICSLGVALLFHSYISPEAYELLVKELAAAYGWRIHRVKTLYDIASCLAAVALSFAFFGFGHFVGVKGGTLLCALLNGPLIGCFGRLLEARFSFADALPLRPFFTGEKAQG